MSNKFAIFLCLLGGRCFAFAVRDLARRAQSGPSMIAQCGNHHVMFAGNRRGQSLHDVGVSIISGSVLAEITLYFNAANFLICMQYRVVFYKIALGARRKFDQVSLSFPVFVGHLTYGFDWVDGMNGAQGARSFLTRVMLPSTTGSGAPLACYRRNHSGLQDKRINRGLPGR